MSLKFVTVSGKRPTNCAVSASPLGFVQSGISGRDHCRSGKLNCWISRNRPNAHRYQPVNSFGMSEFGRSQVLSQPLSNLESTHLISCREDQGELLAAVAGSDIVRSAGRLRENPGEPAQDVVTFLMSRRVVECLEVVEIQQQQGQWLFRPVRPPH